MALTSLFHPVNWLKRFLTDQTKKQTTPLDNKAQLLSSPLPAPKSDELEWFGSPYARVSMYSPKYFERLRAEHDQCNHHSPETSFLESLSDSTRAIGLFRK